MTEAPSSSDLMPSLQVSTHFQTMNSLSEEGDKRALMTKLVGTKSGPLVRGRTYSTVVRKFVLGLSQVRAIHRWGKLELAVRDARPCSSFDDCDARLSLRWVLLERIVPRLEK